jgi:hypothetical protein
MGYFKKLIFEDLIIVFVIKGRIVRTMGLGFVVSGFGWGAEEAKVSRIWSGMRGRWWGFLVFWSFDF